MQLGPYDVTSDTLQESHYLDLFSWDLHVSDREALSVYMICRHAIAEHVMKIKLVAPQGFQPRQGFTAQAHYFLELMMPRDCELY